MAIDLYKNRCSVYEGEKPYIFVSYSHRDIEKVVTLIRQLQSLGFRVWYDSGVPAGADWPEEIASHLKNSGCVLSLLSPSSVRSLHFKEEFNYAKHLEKNILVVYLEECDLTPGIEMRVVSQQCIKCELCEDDDDLLAEIARAKILQPCRGEAELTDTEVSVPDPAPASPKPKTKIESLRDQAEKGSPQAQAELGWAYDNGIGVPRDQAEAVKWYQKAAMQDHRIAQYNLATSYCFGHGVPRDYVEAVKWYQKAADQGHMNAMNSLAARYELGEGIQKDMDKALELYRKAADLGSYSAQYNLGLCYEYSKGVTQDWDEAARWYCKAAEQGHAKAQKKIAELYRKGLGVPMDEAEADRWQKLYEKNTSK